MRKSEQFIISRTQKNIEKGGGILIQLKKRFTNIPIRYDYSAHIKTISEYKFLMFFIRLVPSRFSFLLSHSFSSLIKKKKKKNFLISQFSPIYKTWVARLIHPPSISTIAYGIINQRTPYLLYLFSFLQGWTNSTKCKISAMRTTNAIYDHKRWGRDENSYCMSFVHFHVSQTLLRRRQWQYFSRHYCKCLYKDKGDEI